MRLTWVLLIQGLALIASTVGAGINDVFRWREDPLGRGTNGACAPAIEIPVLGPSWLEAQDIANAALRALKVVYRGKANWDEGTNAYRISRALRAIFGIKTSKRLRSISKDDQRRLETIIDVFQTIILFNEPKAESDRVRMYCNDDWMQWRDKDPSTGNPWPDTPGKWWLPDFKRYYWGSLKSHPCLDGPQTAAFVLYKPPAVQQLSWCPNTFFGFPPQPPSRDRFMYKESLLPQKNDQAHTIPIMSHISDLDSLPGAWIHELTHLLKADVIDQPARTQKGKPMNGKTYGFDRCVWLAQADPDLAILNADNYLQFAIAMYLEYFDWADGFAKPFAYAEGRALELPSDKASLEARSNETLEVEKADATAKTDYPTITDGAYIDIEIALDPAEESSVASFVDSILASEVEQPPAGATQVSEAVMENMEEL